MTEAEHIHEIRLRRIERVLMLLSEIALDVDKIGAITISAEKMAVLYEFSLTMRSFGVKE